MRGNNDVSAFEGNKLTLDEETQCFKKAAELGCLDFRMNPRTHLAEFSVPFCGEWQMIPMDGEDQINRYAAAVCALFFDLKLGKKRLEFRNSGKMDFHGVFSCKESEKEVIELSMAAAEARAFGDKYGAPR